MVKVKKSRLWIGIIAVLIVIFLVGILSGVLSAKREREKVEAEYANAKTKQDKGMFLFLSLCYQDQGAIQPALRRCAPRNKRGTQITLFYLFTHAEIYTRRKVFSLVPLRTQQKKLSARRRPSGLCTWDEPRYQERFQVRDTLNCVQ